MTFSGLSPRVRGNQHRARLGIADHGSIPARAGEPAGTGSNRQWKRVYPRACGGTTSRLAIIMARSGLSPRVRGNHLPVGDHHGAVRSIPARAGEPPPGWRSSWRGPVYPRACGGTRNLLRRSRRWLGLSPRVRGNRPGHRLRRHRHGSIPARAGEPVVLQPRPDHGWVYPRACGGTPMIRCHPTSVRGLSPRVRGNRPHRPRAQLRQGSIPARAGEPDQTP